MRSIATSTFSVLFLFACAQAQEIEFTYSDQRAWNDLTGSFCDRKRQSPINIPTARLMDGEDFGLTPLIMTNWDVPTTGTWTNNGHTLQYTPADVLATTETHLGVYNFNQFHFHWGPNNRVGSEHLVDWDRYSGELHYVHTKAETPDDPGITNTVVGVLLEADPWMDIRYNTIWAELASNIPEFDETTTLSQIVLNDMLPLDLSYYYYEGSLTTPLCNETVQWVVLRDPVKVPAAFFSALRRTSRDEDGRPLKRNYRNTQRRNARPVYFFSPPWSC